MRKVAIASAKRTPIGSFMGSLSSFSAVELGTKVIEAILKENPQVKEKIDMVYMGNVLQAGNGQNPARQAALKAGIPIEVPATTVNTVCGSGLHSVIMAYTSIIAGQEDISIAGGMESMSNAPFLVKGIRNGIKMGNTELIDVMIHDGLTCPFNLYHMGITAENLAEKYNISREEQDSFAYNSQMKASKARKEGKFQDEIIPVTIKTKKEEIIFKDDEYIREDTSLEKLAKLKPAFKANGTVTAGNASGINDGAAAVLVASEEKCNELGLKPLVYIKGFGLAGVEPSIMGIGPVFAIKKMLSKLNISLDEIDLFELNEAFASQSLAVLKELGVDPEKVNVNGGAIALGHPIGASGTRILVTLIHELLRQNKRYGIASLCIGSGMGVAILVENANL
ncbi:acetyl-CoA C-acetyltransferase [Caloramator australicus]|uniref:Acetyl-CoA acetyltransferase n=1 Tax=Caloramator australicus RC3 TaxID=857293 RepID=I7J5C7_9CLOT|nr:acetyl-CoA C-acetyltransferase [Caloramator australicus]CCJ33651.1 3-ketoacyl-CoA thiolase @ Acetyl-CoA acetyltransferase [Caloramator australicus RC3]